MTFLRRLICRLFGHDDHPTGSVSWQTAEHCIVDLRCSRCGARDISFHCEGGEALYRRSAA